MRILYASTDFLEKNKGIDVASFKVGFRDVLTGEIITKIVD